MLVESIIHQAARQTDMTNLTGVFSNLANDPKKSMAYIGQKR